jgi:molecular chaperone GrpE
MIMSDKAKELADYQAGTANPDAPVEDGSRAATGPTEPSAAALTPPQIDELKAKAAKADEHWDRLLRQAADFDNFKKRVARERQDAAKYANMALIEKLIPVLDSFDMAFAAANAAQDPAAKALKEGIAMVFNQFKAVLAEAGLEEIDASNKPFDPNWHEAVAQQERADVAEGIVIQQLRRGYTLRDRLIRPASVIVAKKPAA